MQTSASEPPAVGADTAVCGPIPIPIPIENTRASRAMRMRARNGSLLEKKWQLGVACSVARRVDDFASGLGGDGSPGAEADAVLDELDRAVEEPDVHPAGMVRAGADHGPDRVQDVGGIAGGQVRVGARL